jgi:hypothetical protein
MYGMLAKNEAAARHLPIAHGLEVKAKPARDRQPEARRQSETRLQAAVGASSKREDIDPYADVPCTD